MNIVLFIDTVAFAGTERHVLDLGQSLAQAGAAVVIACPAASPLTPRCLAAGLATLDVPSSLRHAVRTVKILAAELRAGRVDIIHAHNGRTHLLAVAAVKLAGCGRVVATQHFLAPNRTGRHGPKAWLAGMLHRWAEKNTATFIAISQAVKDQMLIRDDAPAEKITVVHNGTTEPEKTSAERIVALRAELGVGDGLMVFCAARLQKEKDIPTLIKAAGDLRFNDQRPMSNDQRQGDDGGGFTTKTQRHEGGAAIGLRPDRAGDTRELKVERTGEIHHRGNGGKGGDFTDQELPMGIQNLEPGILNTENTDNTECTDNTDNTEANSYLLTPSSFPRFFIAGEGDQRAECERLINSLITDHGSRIKGDEKLVPARRDRSEKLEEGNAGDSPQRHEDTKTRRTGLTTEAGEVPEAKNIPARRDRLLVNTDNTECTDNTDNTEANSCLLTSNSSQADGGAIRLLGFRSDVSALMAACDIFVLPAPAEPFGLVLIEAMALGKPVIAAGAGGPLEIVADGETGLLFAPGNAESLATAMTRLLTDAPMRKRMGEAGRKRYEKMFTAQQMAEKMLDSYSVSISIGQY